MCPHDSLDWLYYDYFPEALTRDLADFWPPEAIVAEMTAAGFADVELDRDHRRNERNLSRLNDQRNLAGMQGAACRPGSSAPRAPSLPRGCLRRSGATP